MMPLRWDPFNEVLDLAGGLLAEGGLGMSEPRPGAWSPPVDVFETDDALFVKAEIPGVPPDEIRVEVHGRQLIIAGDRGRPENARRYHHLERLAGPFERRFKLSSDLAADRVEARYAEGVLEVRLPKREEKKGRQIEVKT